MPHIQTTRHVMIHFYIVMKHDVGKLRFCQETTQQETTQQLQQLVVVALIVILLHHHPVPGQTWMSFLLNGSAADDFSQTRVHVSCSLLITTSLLWCYLVE